MRTRIEPGEVHVWTAQTDEARSPGLRQEFRTLLSTSELARSDRFLHDGPRLQFDIAHGLLRTALSHYCSVAPRDWEFSVGEHGKPAIANSHGLDLQFNLTHTRGLAACAICRSLPLGIDAENVSKQVSLDVAKKFAAEEHAHLHSLPDKEQGRAFFQFWTLKEAYMKALGYGLYLPLDAFAICGVGTERPPHVQPTGLHERVSTDWQFFQLRPTIEHELAICVQATRDTWTIVEHHL